MKKIFFALVLVSLTTVSFGNASTLDRYLKKGMSGEDVKTLQEILVKSDVGFSSNFVTGYYGSITAEAVANLQSKYSIDPVGYVGPKTLRVVNVLSEINQPVQNNQSSNTTKTSNSVNVIDQNINTKTSVVTPTNNSVSTPIVNNTNAISSVNSVKNLKQNENRTRSSEYKKIFNENKDIKTGFVKPSFATSTNGTTRVIVRYKNAPTIADEDKIISTKGKKKKVYNLVPLISAEVSDTDIDKISSNPNVLSIEKDEPLKINSDLEYANTWGVTNTGAKSVHLAGFTGKGVKVAVLDTGVDYNHADLISNYVRGFNFVSGTVDPMDDNGHGTHIAGTIAALINGVGVVGESPDARIYAMKVLDANGNGYASDVISALDWAISNGVQVVNLSFGTPNYPGTALEDALINAEAKGLVVVVAAGNSGTCAGDTDTVTYPARFSSVISVGAIDSNNSHACFSSSGPNIELSAPGVSINSTKVGGGETLYSGTSMASPHVAGIAANIISAGVKDLNGNGRINDEVRDILDNSAQDLGTVGRDSIFGFGLVKVDNALAYLSTINTPVIAPIATTTTVIATTTPSTATTTTVINPITTTTPVTSPIVATTSPIIAPIVATTTPVIAPIVATTTPAITQPTIPAVLPAPTSTAISPIKTTPVILPIVLPRVSDQDSNRERIENELENIRKGVQGDLKREENSHNNNLNSNNSNNSSRSNKNESSKSDSGKKSR